MNKQDRKLIIRYLDNIEKHAQCDMNITNNIKLIKEMLDYDTKLLSSRANIAWKTKLEKNDKYLN